MNEPFSSLQNALRSTSFIRCFGGHVHSVCIETIYYTYIAETNMEDKLSATRSVAYLLTDADISKHL